MNTETINLFNTGTLLKTFLFLYTDSNKILKLFIFRTKDSIGYKKNIYIIIKYTTIIKLKNS